MVSGAQVAAVLSSSEVSQKKLEENIARYVLGEKDKKGATKKKVYTIPPKNTTSAPTASQGRKSALKSNTKNNTMYTQELVTAVSAMVDVPDISKEDKERVLLKVGASLPFIFLGSKGGGRGYCR